MHQQTIQLLNPLFALSKNLARKLAPKIRVNVIAPGNVLFLVEYGNKSEKKISRV